MIKWWILLVALWSGLASLVWAFSSFAPLDTFNRANQGPPPSTSWTSSLISTHLGLQVLSNALVVGSLTHGSSWWNVTAFPANQAASVVLSDATVPDTAVIRILLRVAQPGVANQTDGYTCRAAVNVTPSLGNMSFRRLDNSIESATLATSATFTWADGDSFGCEMIGAQLCGWRKAALTDVWTRMHCITDTTYTAGGFIGMWHSDTVYSTDDFWAGPALPGRRVVPVE